MSARDKLIRLARENTPDYGNHVPCDPETGFMFMGHDEYIAHVEKLLDEYAHELAERIRNVHGSGEGDAWNWWDAADIPGACADLIDPQKSAGPVRPDEETTT
jgi:hypothetical protein